MKHIIFTLKILVIYFTVSNQVLAKEFDHEIVPSKATLLFNLECERNVHYRVSYRKKGSSQWQHFPIVHLNGIGGSTINKRCPHNVLRVKIPNLQCKTSYQIRALRLHSGVKVRVYNADTLPCVPPGAVRLKHLQTNKCVYTYQHGNSFSTWKVHNWGCWNDPKMAFTIVPAGGGYFKIKDPKSGLCLATSNTNNYRIFLYGCSQNYNGLFFTKDGVGNGKFRLRSKFNQCMFGTPTNGGDVKSWVCWNDPNMEFIFEYY